jgi:hypothetical protein
VLTLGYTFFESLNTSARGSDDEPRS